MKTEDNTTLKPNGYLLLFRNTEWDKGNLLPEEYAAVIERVKAWLGRLEDEGKIAASQPLLNECKLVSGKGGRSVTDRPFAEAKEAVGGFILLKTTDLNEAIAVAQGNPMLDHGLVVEVRPTSEICPTMHRVSQLLTAVES